MFGLLPKNLEFFDFFERSAANAFYSAELLEKYTKQGDLNNRELVHAIIEAEHVGDKITHETLDRLERTYITPIDREDIHKLISRIDDVVDTIDAVAQRMMYYKIDSVKLDFQNQCGVLVKAARSMMEAVAGLRQMTTKKGKNSDRSFEQRLIAVHEAEEEADRIHHLFLAQLFESGLDPFQVIKWKELYELVEQATDFCDDVACIMHGIVLKNM